MQHSVKDNTPQCNTSLHPVNPVLYLDSWQELMNSCEISIMEEMIDLEHLLDKCIQEQRHSLINDAFNQLVEYLPGYCPLLMAIKGEFEQCIQTIKRGNQEALYLSGKVKSMAAEQTTLSYFAKRVDQLKEVLYVIESNNKLLNHEKESILSKRGSHLQDAEQSVMTVEAIKTDTPGRLLPGLMIGESIDAEYLHKLSSNLTQQFKDLHQSKKNSYAAREQKKKLKMQLSTKTKAKDHVTEKNLQLKSRCRKLRIAHDALRVYEKDPLLGPTQAEAVIRALTRSNSMMSSRSGDVVSTVFDDDDPSKEREAEMLLEYIEHFNELFEEGKYKDAAMHAASSPKGILMNSETLSRFRAIHARSGKSPPLLVYCEALISSVPAVGSPPDAETSLECVKSALSEDRLDLVMHWLSQERLTCSEPLGHLLYNYTLGKSAEIISKSLPLAEAVYTLVDAHIQAAVCMCKQGKVQAMMDYAIHAEFGKDMSVGVLVACPSVALAEVLIQPRGLEGKPTLSVGTVVFELLQTENYAIGLQLLERVHHSIQAGDLKTTVKDIVLSDPTTTSDAWLQIGNKCLDCGLHDMGLQVLAAVLVQKAVKEAADKMSSLLV